MEHNMPVTPKKDARAETLRNAPPDSWVVLSSDGSTIVAVGKTYKEVSDKCDALGIEDPVLVKTPTEWLPLAV
jgi:hypothetical protein